MENTKLTATQKEAIDLVQDLVKQEKIDFNEAFLLIRAIYEKEKEFVYIPYQSPYIEPYVSPYTKPWTTSPDTTGPVDMPWWERNKIWCDMNNTNSTQGGSDVLTYVINGQKRDPLDWTIDTWIG